MRTRFSPDKVPQLPGVDRQEYDTQESQCARGIESGENNKKTTRNPSTSWIKPRWCTEIGSGNSHL